MDNSKREQWCGFEGRTATDELEERNKKPLEQNELETVCNRISSAHSGFLSVWGLPYPTLPCPTLPNLTLQVEVAERGEDADRRGDGSSKICVGAPRVKIGQIGQVGEVVKRNSS